MCNSSQIHVSLTRPVSIRRVGLTIGVELMCHRWTSCRTRSHSALSINCRAMERLTPYIPTISDRRNEIAKQNKGGHTEIRRSAIGGSAPEPTALGGEQFRRDHRCDADCQQRFQNDIRGTLCVDWSSIGEMAHTH